MEGGLVTQVQTQEVQTDKLYPLKEGASDALVVHCSDPRFQDAFHDFIRDELGIERPAAIVLPGSTASFGVQNLLPKRWHALRNQIELMAEHNDFPRVILINHDDCKGYAGVAKFIGGLHNISSSQRSHLHSLAKYILKEYLPNARVELYQARIVERNNIKGVKFEKVV